MEGGYEISFLQCNVPLFTSFPSFDPPTRRVKLNLVIVPSTVANISIAIAARKGDPILALSRRATILIRILFVVTVWRRLADFLRVQLLPNFLNYLC